MVQGHRGDREVDRARPDRQRERVAPQETDLRVVAHHLRRDLEGVRVAVQREHPDAPALAPRPAHQLARDVPRPGPHVEHGDEVVGGQRGEQALDVDHGDHAPAEQPVHARYIHHAAGHVVEGHR